MPKTYGTISIGAGTGLEAWTGAWPGAGTRKERKLQRKALEENTRLTLDAHRIIYEMLQEAVRSGLNKW